MNIGILTEGAFSCFRSSDWRTRLGILTNGAFTPFIVIEEAIVFGIFDLNTSDVRVTPFSDLRDKETVQVSDSVLSRITDIEQEKLIIIGVSDISDSEYTTDKTSVDTFDITDKNIGDIED